MMGKKYFSPDSIKKEFKTSEEVCSGSRKERFQIPGILLDRMSATFKMNLRS